MSQLFDELGWRPEHFAAKLTNQAVLHGRCERVHPKTPYKWLSGQRPRPPWPELAAALLSAELTRTITPQTLGWPAVTTGVEHLQPADSGLAERWTGDGALRTAHAVTEGACSDGFS